MKHFENYVATKIVETDKILAVELKNGDRTDYGSIDFVVNLTRGTIMITSDFGYCIAGIGRQISIAELPEYFSSAESFVEHIKASTDIYTYCKADIVSDLEQMRDDVIKAYLEDNDPDNDRDIALLKKDFGKMIDIAAYPPSPQLQMLYEKYADPEEDNGLMCAGKRISPKVYLWCEAITLALKQLYNY